MRFFISFILISLLAALAETFVSWWIVVVVALLVTLFTGLRPGRAFGAGFAGIGLLWLILSLVHDIPNDHILSSRMAALFHLPNYTMFVLVTVIVGGLVGGLGGWCGSLLRRII